MWVRGLKPFSLRYTSKSFKVAPRVGAWIETPTTVTLRYDARVAPRVGAWIETKRHRYPRETKVSHPVWVRGLKPFWTESIPGTDRSHPVWVRGLKQLEVPSDKVNPGVAPRVGAWIETPDR